MGLEEFISDSKSDNDESYHDNPKIDKEKLYRDDLCPECGTEAEHIRGIEYRCPKSLDECQTLYYIALS